MAHPPSAAGDAGREVLARVFGHRDFRPGQAEAVESALSGRDVLVLLPTGSGKSICYQVPALALAERGAGTTVVVSPLIALMQDQVGALVGRGLAAAALNSHQDEATQRESIGRFERGELALLYVSPERAAQAGFRRLLARVPVALYAIDEAHCVSQWGHDFRPDYMRLRELVEIAPAPMMALTATATPRVLEEIATRLGLTAPHLVRTGFDRPNLAFAVRSLRREEERIDALLEALDADRIRGRGGRGRAIVYCSTRKTTERVARALRGAGLRVGHYHAGRSQSARERTQAAFEAGRTRVLVATNAFGMGIDLPDVRLIVHFQTPGSLEAYYQEAGRAGRDGEPARCLLFFGAADLATQRRLARSGPASAVLDARREAALLEMELYATRQECRHGMLVAHFSGEGGGAACGCCDVCLGTVGSSASGDDLEDRLDELEPLSPEAHETIVAAVGRLTRPVGRRPLAQALRGGRARSLSRGGLLTLPEYGALAAFREEAIFAAIDALLAEGRLVRPGGRLPTVWLAGRPLAASGASGRRATRETARARAPARRHGGDIARALEGYRSRQARMLGWKTWMVFQRHVMLAIERAEPRSLAELARVPGLGPSKIERFGEDILALVRQHRVRGG